jgi:PPP family 3-phenylpropionic acid transporter
VRRAASAYIVLFIGVACWSPYLSLYYQSLGIPLGQIGALMAFTSAVALVCAPLWGSIHDRYPRSFVLLPIAGGLLSCGAFGLLNSGATLLLIPSAALFAMGTSGLAPMMDVRVLEQAGSDRTRYGRIRACGSASFMVAAPLVGLLKDNQGAGSIFWVLIPAGLAGAFLATLIPGRVHVGRMPSIWRAPGTVLRHRPIAFYLLGSFICLAAVSAQSVYLGPYLRSLGASNQMIGWAASLGAAVEVPMMVFFPRLARRFGVERLILLGAVIIALRQIANAAFTDPSILVACTAFQGAGWGLLVVGGVTFVSKQAPRGTAATAQGLLSGAAFSLASIAGVGIGGQLAALLTIRGMYAVTVVVGFAAVLVIAAAVLPYVGSHPQEPPAAYVAAEG